MSITPQTKSWLRQSAAVDGAAYSQVLLYLLERVEALEQRPIPGFVDLAAPAPEAAPVATDEEQPLPPHIAMTYQPKSVYQPLRPAQPAPLADLAAKLISESKPMDPEMAEALTPEARWDLYSGPDTPPAPEPGEVAELVE